MSLDGYDGYLRLTFLALWFGLCAKILLIDKSTFFKKKQQLCFSLNKFEPVYEFLALQVFCMIHSMRKNQALYVL